MFQWIVCDELISKAAGRKLLKIGLCCLSLCLLTDKSAFADITGFPGAEWTNGVIDVNGDSMPFYGPGAPKYTGGPIVEGPSETLTISTQGGSGTLFGSLLPNPAVSASLTNSTGSLSTANLDLVFHAEIFGPPGPVNLQVYAPGSATTTGGGGVSASAALYLNGLFTAAGVATDYTFAEESLNGKAEVIPYPALPDGVTLSVLPDVMFEAELQVSVGARSFASAQAMVDPFFVLPAGYTIELSPGVGNEAAPELSTWAMMALGFAGVGALGWRASRRRRMPQEVEAR